MFDIVTCNRIDIQPATC